MRVGEKKRKKEKISHWDLMTSRSRRPCDGTEAWEVKNLCIYDYGNETSVVY
jgi:hypothetical protein